MNSILLRLCTLKLMFLTVLLAHSCSVPDKEYIVYVGTYTGKGSEGIYAYRFNATSGALISLGLAAKTINPSFLEIDPEGKFLYAVNETDTFQDIASGAVSVFSIDRKSAILRELQVIPSTGSAPCHLSLDKTGKYLMVANYNGGNAAVFPLGQDGKLERHTAFVQDSGSSVNPKRQAGPHAHFIQTTPDNRFALMADLGTDKIMRFQFDESTGSLSPTDPEFAKLMPGEGPRHIAFHSSGQYVYVINELSSSVTVFSFDSINGNMGATQTISALPANFNGSSSAAEIALDSQCKFLYTSNRGNNTITCFRVNTADGSLSDPNWFSTEGETPRHFVIDPTGQWLLVANQGSHNIIRFRIEKNTGHLTRQFEPIELNSPVCISFLD